MEPRLVGVASRVLGTSAWAADVLLEGKDLYPPIGTPARLARRPTTVRTWNWSSPSATGSGRPTAGAMPSGTAAGITNSQCDTSRNKATRSNWPWTATSPNRSLSGVRCPTYE